MTHDEIKELLDVCSAGLRQPADPRDEMIWAATLGDLPFGEARAAIVEWLRTSPYWPRPADLRERARLIAARNDRERAKRNQLEGRIDAVEADIHAAHARKRTGANMVRHILGRLKDAGSDPAEGKFLGAETAAAVAEEAVHEWLDRTRETS
jgi:hypothetical protein